MMIRPIQFSAPLLKPKQAAPVIFGSQQPTFFIQPDFEAGGFSKNASLQKQVNPGSSSDAQVTVIRNKTALNKLWKLLGSKQAAPVVDFKNQRVAVLITQKLGSTVKGLERKSFTTPFTTLQAPHAVRTFELNLDPGRSVMTVAGTAWYLGVIEECHVATPPQIMIHAKPTFFP